MRPFFLLALAFHRAFLRGIDRTTSDTWPPPAALGGASLVHTAMPDFLLLAAQAAILIIASLDEKFDLKLMLRRCRSWGLAPLYPLSAC
jgi:hypothetical protein